MDTTALVEPDIEGGRRLVSALDEQGTEVPAALWLYSSSSDSWRLLVATPLVDSKGPRAAYERIQAVLGTLDPRIKTPLSHISVVSPASDIVRLLRSTIRTGNELSEIRFKDNVIDGTLIEDAVIYRVQ